MTRIWITAQPSASEVVVHVNRWRLRRTYRMMRKTMNRHQARVVIFELLCTAQSEFKP